MRHLHLHRPGVGIGIGRLVLLAALLAQAACTPIAPTVAPSVAPTPVPPAPSARTPPTADAGPDFDGDGGADLVVGIGEGIGRVSVRYANGRDLDFGRQDVDSTQPDSVDFGQAVLARDLNGDGFTDLVVSDPGLGPSLYWIYGTATGLDLAGRVVTTMDAFPGGGRALALVTEPKLILAVSGGSSGGTGVVLGYELGADGRPTAEPTQLTPAALGLPDLPTGSSFGATLAASGWLLAIGAPRADVGTARQAGAVFTVDLRREPLRATRITQDVPGVPDTAQSGDRFGAALAAGDGYVAVGVPGEDREDEQGHRQPHTGMVQLFLILSSDLKADREIDQRDLPGNVEAGDLFGSAVSMVHPCPKTVGVLVGASAERIGRQDQAGSAWLVPVAGQGGCVPLQLYEGNGLGGKPAAHTLVGSSVSVLRQSNLDGDTLVIVAMGTWEEGVPGRVLTLDYPYTGSPIVAQKDLAIRDEKTIALSSPAG